jgi:hypothetical protein
MLFKNEEMSYPWERRLGGVKNDADSKHDEEGSAFN